MSGEALLEVKDVTMRYAGNSRRGVVVALEDFSLNISDEPASIVTIAGESGSGKSTLARLILGMMRPTDGEIRYDGKNIWEMNRGEQKAYRREVQAIFQDPFAVFNPFYPVDRLLYTPLRSFGLVQDRAHERQLIEGALERVGLRAGEVLRRYPHQLSGGQRQRLVIARSLLLKPKLIVADEPVSMIDASLRASILETLQQLRDELGISLLYVTHDLATANQISDRIFILYRGQVVEEGESSTVIRKPKHPYSQLLVSSIPRPDPEKPWQDRIEIPLQDLGSGLIRGGCLFRQRCPHRMPECEQQPPAVEISKQQTVVCYLYEEQPAVERAKSD